MKISVRSILSAIIRFLAPHAGLGVLTLTEFEFSNDADNLDWNSEELPPAPRFLTEERITIH